MTDTEVTVGRIGRAHGIKGEVAVEVRTDEPERRFAPGSVLGLAGTRSLTVSASRWHQGRLLVRFDELTDRTTRGERPGRGADGADRPPRATRATPRSSTTGS